MQTVRRSMGWFAAAMALVSVTACGGGGGGDDVVAAGGSGGVSSPSPSPAPDSNPGGPPAAPSPSAPPPAGTPPAAPPPGSGTEPIPDPGTGPGTSPFNLTITAAPQRGLKFDWTPVAGALNYRIDQDVDANDGVDSFGFAGSETAPALSHTLTGLRLPEALNHKYRIRAFSETGSTLATTTVTVSGDLAASIESVSSPLDDSLGNRARVMATAQRGLANVLAVGMPGANQGMGMVKLYERGSAGPWTEVQTLAAPQGAVGSFFGASVALSPNGQYLAVGIPGDDRATQGMGINPQLTAGMEPVPKSGAVEVYRHSGEPGTGWVRQAWFKAVNAGPDDAFGTAVAISDEGHLIVGAPNEDSSAYPGMYVGDTDPALLGDDRTNGLDRGAVYAYSNNASGYQFAGYIKPPITGGGVSLYFGAAVALDRLGQRLAVGAPHASYNGRFAGGVVIYDLDWNASQPYMSPFIVAIPTERSVQGPGSDRDSVARENAAPSSPAYQGLGGSLAMSQDGLWLAAGYATRSGLVSGTGSGSGVALPRNAGQVNVYRRQDITWSLHAPLVAPVPSTGDRFGTSLALVNGSRGVRLLVGAPGDSSGHNGLMRAAQVVAGAPASAFDAAGAGYYFESGPDQALPLVLKARLKAPDRVAGQVLGQASAMTSDGNGLLLSGEYKNNASEPFANALFFGY